MALGSTQKGVPGVFPGGKGGRCVRLTTYHHPVPLSRNLGTLTYRNPLGPSGPVTGLLYHAVWTNVCFIQTVAQRCKNIFAIRQVLFGTDRRTDRQMP